jgi:hypothetical protein
VCLVSSPDRRVRWAMMIFDDFGKKMAKKLQLTEMLGSLNDNN